MGVSISRYSEITDNEYLARLCSKEIVKPNDPFWNKLLSFNIVLPKNVEEQLLFDASTERLNEKFLENNLQTGNLGSLVHVFMTRANELLGAPCTDNPMLAWQTFNALVVIRAIAKYLIETVPEYQLCQHFDAATPVVVNGSQKQNGTSAAEQHSIESQTQSEGVPEEERESNSLLEKERDQAVSENNERPPVKLNAEESRLECLIDCLIRLIVDVPVTDNTYFLHLECLNTIMVLMSVYIISHGQARPAESSVIFRALYYGRYSKRAPDMVKILLYNLSSMTLSPEHMFGVNKSQGSVVLGLASGIWSVLTLSTNSNRRQSILASPPTDQSDLERRLKCDHPIANQSCLLLLALTNHCCSDNPYRKAFLGVVDVSSDPTSVPTKKANGETITDCAPVRIEMAALHRALCLTASCEHSTLLIYLLLHACKTYKKYVCTMSSIEHLIVPILMSLYAAPDSNSHHNYMSLIIILILSEDDALNKSLHNIMIKNPTWYTERSISEISLGGLTVLVILRTVQYNILRVRDKYLHTNCLAALANMSSEFRNLHPYVAQRLVSLYEILTKRKKKLEEKAEGDINELNDFQGLDLSKFNADEKRDALYESIEVLEEVQRMLLEILNSCLSHDLAGNVNLVYALLYKRDLFTHQQHPSVLDVIHNLENVVGFFSSRLQRVQDGVGGDLSVTEVLATIKKGAEQWTSDRLKKLPSLKFRYVEEDRPEEFFTPYVWSLMVTCGNIFWASEAGVKAHRELTEC